jgi:hypothetical protein
VTFHVWHLLREAFQVGNEGLELGEALGVLHALHVAFERVFVRGADGDDPVGARHLKLQVGVVGDGHELRVAWPSQNRVVRPGHSVLRFGSVRFLGSCRNSVLQKLEPK